MENYTKGETKKEYDPPRLFLEGAVEMKVTGGSKIRNLMGFAMSSMGDKSVRHMTWNGTGNAINKTISCVEIMKRKVKGLHQITQIGYMRVEDFWEPSIEGLDTLKVNTNIPAISILLSKDPLDSNDPSYQAPGATDVVWAGTSKRRHQFHSHKNKLAAVRDVKSAASRPKRAKGDRRDGKKSSGKKKDDGKTMETS
ncbi:ribonuclease P protein subunit p25-like protein [Aplysia californica]|uniref:Ribonuclease P protein subunit p25-like protein n=1 Tax=Aplysia californica TaxID=6500 RepID=A0ABM1VXA4_APLCA|nr:ribonuclease P protein subunit p25-like protein [Aplysia californica]XP_005103750.1 ribonuclease P protein subunit p25-like protein [Aplysia californica]XP_035827047.1 ribonuclease P protein subunit p25-like protein [Aplysia californica]